MADTKSPSFSGPESSPSLSFTEQESSPTVRVRVLQFRVRVTFDSNTNKVQYPNGAEIQSEPYNRPPLRHLSYIELFGLIDMSISISSVSQIFTSVCRPETDGNLQDIIGIHKNRLLTHTVQ